jgi:acyl dehydratase
MNDHDVAIGQDMNAFRWEDIVLGEIMRSGIYTVTEDEIVTFARKFDPLPIHVDRDYAATGPFGTLTASGTHMLAIKQRLMHDFVFREGVLASLGFDETRFLAPLRPDQRCQIEVRFVEKRPSGSRADRGIAQMSITFLADDEPVMTQRDNVLMHRRVPVVADNTPITPVRTREV